MTMTKVKTNELVGPALNYMVAKVVDYKVALTDNQFGPDEYIVMGRDDMYLTRDPVGFYVWSPSADWAQGGMILEANDWALPYRATHRSHLGKYEACTPGGFPHNGATPLIAAMRAIVAAKIGDVVSVPSELLEAPE